ncbi:MAG: hypothetical protein KME29_12185 [Calothrix sp. FI2-JRJ7]|jgi:hypothetical protein|nr:hypothetical protein [Calothrix sp. FI2-JRJ7]
MTDLDLLHHIATIENHLVILQQFTPYSELWECSNLLHKLSHRLLNQNALAPTTETKRINDDEICEILLIPQNLHY